MKNLRNAMVLAVIAALVMTTSVFAIFFNNGNFEAGDWTPGWDAPGQRELLVFNGGYDGTGFPNLTSSRTVGATTYNGADLSSVVGGAAVPALSISDPRTITAGDPAGVVKYPAVGHYSAKVNNEDSNTGGGFPYNANTLFQTATIDAGDIDSIDNMVHLRLLYAAVVSFPREDLGATAHTFDELPMFFLEVKNVTDNVIIFHRQSYAGEPGVPWQDGPMMNANSQWKFLDWSYVDVIVGDASMVGKTISVEIVATGCSLGGHPGYIYVDELGSSHVGIPAVVATGPATRHTGDPITYTYNYFNGSSDSINPTIYVNPPVGVTFNSADPACTSDGSGGYDCTFTDVPANSGGSFDISGTVTAAAGSTINHGDYQICATGYPCLNGPVVVTNVLASNTAPVAANNSYSTKMSSAFNGSSVLTNDSDADNDTLTAILVTAPKHASQFTFNSNGTFSYEPENGYKGFDDFYYKANDGTEDSKVVRVRIRIRPHVMTIRSTNTQDGWVLESAQNSDEGGPFMTAFDMAELRLGDGPQNEQYRSIVSFNLVRLSNSAVIVGGSLNVRDQGTVGPIDPFGVFGNIIADMKTGFFGRSPALEDVDFHAAATQNNVGPFKRNGNQGWYRMILVPDIFNAFDLVGDRTQFRLRFATQDNNDLTANYERFFSGSSATTNNPTLTIWYYVPHP